MKLTQVCSSRRWAQRQSVSGNEVGQGFQQQDAVTHAGDQLLEALAVQLEQNIAVDVVGVEDGDVVGQKKICQPLPDLLELIAEGEREGVGGGVSAEFDV